MHVFEGFCSFSSPTAAAAPSPSPPSTFPSASVFYSALFSFFFPLSSVLTLSCPSFILLFLFSSSKQKKGSTLNFFNNQSF